MLIIVSREANAFYTGVTLRQFLNDIPRAISSAILDQKQFEVWSNRFNGADDTAMQLPEEFPGSDIPVRRY